MSSCSASNFCIRNTVARALYFYKNELICEQKDILQVGTRTPPWYESRVYYLESTGEIVGRVQVLADSLEENIYWTYHNTDRGEYPHLFGPSWMDLDEYPLSILLAEFLYLMEYHYDRKS